MGYSDRPFDFAYLWLDYAGFNGLLGRTELPYSERTTRGKLVRHARLLERTTRMLSTDIKAWPFHGALQLNELVRPTDYGSTVVIHPSVKGFTKDQIRIGTRIMHAGARQELQLGLSTLLDRAADALRQWEPPERLGDRPNRAGARTRFAARWLERILLEHGGDFPGKARVRLIAELVAVLGQLGDWREEPWSEERVRRCLDGKPRKRA